MDLQTMSSFKDEMTKIAVSSEWGAKRIVGGLATRMKGVTAKNLNPTEFGPRAAAAMATTSRFAEHQMKRGKKFGPKMLDAVLKTRPDVSKKMDAIEKAMNAGTKVERAGRVKEMRKGLKGKTFSKKGIQKLDGKASKGIIRKIQNSGGVVA